MDTDQIEDLYYEQVSTSTDYEWCEECEHPHEAHTEDGCALCDCEMYDP